MAKITEILIGICSKTRKFAQYDIGRGTKEEQTWGSADSVTQW
jgi:hypothetical protein